MRTILGLNVGCSCCFELNASNADGTEVAAAEADDVGGFGGDLGCAASAGRGETSRRWCCCEYVEYAETYPLGMLGGGGGTTLGSSVLVRLASRGERTVVESCLRGSGRSCVRDCPEVADVEAELPYDVGGYRDASTEGALRSWRDRDGSREGMWDPCAREPPLPSRPSVPSFPSRPLGTSVEPGFSGDSQSSFGTQTQGVCITPFSLVFLCSVSLQ